MIRCDIRLVERIFLIECEIIDYRDGLVGRNAKYRVDVCLRGPSPRDVINSAFFFVLMCIDRWSLFAAVSLTARNRSFSKYRDIYLFFCPLLPKERGGGETFSIRTISKISGVRDRDVNRMSSGTRKIWVPTDGHGLKSEDFQSFLKVQKCRSD